MIDHRLAFPSHPRERAILPLLYARFPSQRAFRPRHLSPRRLPELRLKYHPLLARGLLHIAAKGAWLVSLPEDVVASRKRPTRSTEPNNSRKSREPRLAVIHFYRILDHLPTRSRSYFITLAISGLRITDLCELRCNSIDYEERAIRVKDSKTETGLRTIYIAEVFWFWVLAAVAQPITQWDLRDQWNGAVGRAGLRKVRLGEIRRLRGRLLAEARHRPGIRLLGDQAQEDARLLTQLLPVLTLSEYEGRRLLLRRVP
jgi:integrase